MSPRRGAFRVVMMFWAVLQLAVPTVAVVADTAAAVSSAGVHAHVEPRSDASCVRVHDAKCVFCQFLATGAAPVGLSVAATVAGFVRQQTGFSASVPDLDAMRGVPLPRAPPVA